MCLLNVFRSLPPFWDISFAGCFYIIRGIFPSNAAAVQDKPHCIPWRTRIEVAPYIEQASVPAS
jgi:hypothetical protein